MAPQAPRLILALGALLFAARGAAAATRARADSTDPAPGAKKKAVEAINAVRSVNCPHEPPLDHLSFVVKKRALEGEGETISMILESTRKDQINVILASKDKETLVENADILELQQCLPKPCDIGSDDVGRQDGRVEGRLLSTSLEWAEMRVNEVRREQCPRAGSIVFVARHGSRTRVVSGVELTARVTAQMPADINIPGDEQVQDAEHTIIVRWEVPQPGATVTASAEVYGAKSHGEEEGVVRTSLSDPGTAPPGLWPTLLLPVPACRLLSGSTEVPPVGGASRRLGDAERGPSLPELFAGGEEAPVRRPGRRLGAIAPHFEEQYDARSRYPQCYDGHEIVNQGDCASSWAVAAVGAVGDRMCQMDPNSTLTADRPGGTKVRTRLSHQRVLSCNEYGLGCDGGSVYTAFLEMKGTAGAVPEFMYPSSSHCWNGEHQSMVDLPMKAEFRCEHISLGTPWQQWPCECVGGSRQMPRCHDTVKATSRVLGYYRLPTVFDEKGEGMAKYAPTEVIHWMQSELLERGPYAVGMEVYDDFFYFGQFGKGGVYACGAEESEYLGGHAVVALGWGTTKNREKYWLLRNSWGPEWGDKGLFRVQRGGSGSCLLEQWMAVPEVASEVATCDDTPWLGLHAQKDLFRCRGMKGGSVCEVTCQAGYRLMPQEGLRCEPTGRWSTAWCEPLPCKEPPSVEHRLLPVTGETCTTNTLEEPICPVECVAGYESSGDALCVAGKWAVQPVCVPSLCGKPPEIAHAGPVGGCAGRGHDGVCEVPCQAGYNKTGDVTCQLGKWTEAECRPLPCPFSPPIAHCVGCEYGAGSPSGSVLKISCEAGYEKSGDPVCELGHWSTVECRPNSCARIPNVLHAMDLAHCAGKADGEECWVQCQEGFYLSGTLACSLGQWTRPTCSSEPQATVCTTEPQVIGSEDPWKCKGVASGKACNKLGCELGRSFQGDPPLCVNGEWTHAFCEWTPCQEPPVVEHASGIDRCRGAPHGSKCLLTCDAGFAPTFPYVKCDRGSWESPPRCAPSHCVAIPRIAHVASDLTSCHNATAGAKCPFECEQGYEPEGELQCSDGNWNAPLCKPKPCENGPNVVHGADLSGCKGLASGNVCEVICNRGYKKLADLVCMLGEWSPEMDVCEPMRCLQPPVVENAAPMGQCQGMASGGQCEVQCLPGHRRSGDGPECRLGAWSHGEVECEPMPCDMAPNSDELPNANVARMQDCAGVSSGKPCPLVCKGGYQASGDLMCNLGQWLTGSAQCVPLKENDPAAAALARQTGRRLAGDGPESSALGGALIASAIAKRPCGSTPRVPHSEDLVACKNRRSGELCPLQCRPGFRKTTDLWCEDGVWNPPAPAAACVPLTCRAADLFVDKGVVPRDSECDGLPSGLACTFRCEPGFYCSSSPAPPNIGSLGKLPFGACTASCNLGSWNTTGVSCVERPCLFRPAVVHAEIATLEQCRGMPSGRQCDFKCRAGWHPYGNLLCTHGVWQRAECRPDMCGSFGGEMEASGSSDSAQALAVPPPQQGSEGIQCKAPPLNQGLGCQRGDWIGIAQSGSSCRRCLMPPDIPNSRDTILSCADMPSGSACRLMCETGYEPSRVSVHCEDGVWQAAECKPKSCVNPEEVRNAVEQFQTECRELASYKSCPLRCLEGYSATGDLLCSLGEFNKPMCHPVGFLGFLHVNLVEDTLSGQLAPDTTGNSQVPNWYLVKVSDPPTNSTVVPPKLAMRSISPSKFPPPEGQLFSTRLDLPALHVGPSGGTITFRYRVDSEKNADFLRFFVDGEEQRSNGFPRSGPARDPPVWSMGKFPLMPGLHSCTWIYEKDAEDDVGEDAAWVGGVIVENAVKIGVDHVPLIGMQTQQEGTFGRWKEVLAETPRGETGLVLQSGHRWAGEPEDDARLVMTMHSIEIAPPHGTISFFYKISSERGYDELHFDVNGAEMTESGFPASGRISEWTLAQFRLPAGRHSVTWRYQKDSRNREGDDVAWVSDIQVRNMKVPPVTLSLILSVTHVNGDLGSGEEVMEEQASEVFGRPATDLGVVVKQADAPPSQGRLRRLQEGDSASMYMFYDITVGVSCASSFACANISATMQRIKEDVEILAIPFRFALQQPMMKVLSTGIDHDVAGNPAPGMVAEGGSHGPSPELISRASRDQAAASSAWAWHSADSHWQQGAALGSGCFVAILAAVATMMACSQGLGGKGGDGHLFGGCGGGEETVPLTNRTESEEGRLMQSDSD